MKLESVMKFDPTQEVLTLSSSAVGAPFLEGDGVKTSTSGPPSQQCFVDPTSLPSSKTRSLDPNLVQADTTAFLGNSLPQEEPVSPVVFLRRAPLVQNRFIPLQKWEGTVLQVLKESFFARLVDLTSGGMDEEAEFPLEEVSDADRSLVEPGAVFYWNIGYVDSLSGQRTRASVIRLRRLPVWGAEELERAKQKAQYMSDELDWK
jgi:hypothetical protein